MTVVEAGTGSSIFSQPQDTGSAHLDIVNYGNTAADPIYLKFRIKTTVAITIEDNVWAHRAYPEIGHENSPASVRRAAGLPARVRGTIPVGADLHIPGPDGRSSCTVRRQVRENFSGEHRLTGVVRHVYPSLRASEKQSAGRIRHSTFGQTIVPGSEK